MKITHQVSLKNYNTFGIDVTAQNFVSITSTNELKKALTLGYTHTFLLGGGSNILLTKNINDALVIHLNIKGIYITKENDDFVWITANAGENWHEFVLWCIARDFGGLENMSLIPGNVGTAPIQNIGAYGKELKDNFISCEVIEISSGKSKNYSKDECNFQYRNSIFKNELKGKCIITAVTFKLTKRNHNTNTSYGAIETELSSKKINTPSIVDISNAVTAIRQSKLPDPKILGNSGSFFKNPVVSKKRFNSFIAKFPDAPSYIISNTEVKIPAGWLIEQAGFKGKRFGNAGIHKNQALVIVNHGNASGKEIWDLAMMIKNTVFKKFGIEITPEVNIY